MVFVSQRISPSSISPERIYLICPNGLCPEHMVLN